MTTCSNAGGGHGSPVFGEVSCDGGVVVVVVTVVAAVSTEADPAVMFASYGVTEVMLLTVSPVPRRGARST